MHLSGETLTAVSHTKVTGDVPVAYMLDLLPTTVASLDQMWAGYSGSTLDFLLAQYNLSLAYTWQRPRDLLSHSFCRGPSDGGLAWT